LVIRPSRKPAARRWSSVSSAGERGDRLVAQRAVAAGQPVGEPVLRVDARASQRLLEDRPAGGVQVGAAGAMALRVVPEPCTHLVDGREQDVRIDAVRLLRRLRAHGPPGGLRAAAVVQDRVVQVEQDDLRPSQVVLQ
jgi:hypothetical protein